MFSSKTSTLIARMLRAQVAGKNVAVVCWSGDVRYGDDGKLHTHDGGTFPCFMFDDHDMEMNLTELAGYDVIGIDEGSFFKGIVKWCEMLANEAGVHVIVATLLGDFRRDGFNDILNLLPRADAIQFLTAVCMGCKTQDAPFTARLCASPGDVVELVGGAESYVSLCRHCYENQPMAFNTK